MPRPLLLFAATLLLATGLIAGPAAAEVIDRAGVFSGTEIQTLERKLDALGPHRVDVYFEERVSGLASAMAERSFDEEGLGPKDAVIVVGMNDRKVGVHVGGAFVDRGVDSAAVSRRIKRDFTPAAKRGEFDAAVLALSKGLIADGARPGTASEPQPSSESGEDGGGGGLILLLLVGAVALGGGFFVYGKVKGKKDAASALARLQERHHALVNETLKLEEVGQLAKFAEGDGVAAYRKLNDRSTRVLGAVKQFSDQLVEAEEMVKAGKRSEFDSRAAELHEQLDALRPDIAAVLTAVAMIEAGGDAVIAGELPERAERGRRRLREVERHYRKLHSQAQSVEYFGDGGIEGRLKEAEELLLTVPIDPEGAEKAIAEAAGDLDPYRARVEEAAVRFAEVERVREEARAAEAAREAAQAAAAAVTVASISSSHSSSWSSSDGASADDSWGGGASADDSWGSDDSGASADDNW